jgi:dipeptidyl aminopeptidase/acylaminoacyl peptidase
MHSLRATILVTLLSCGAVCASEPANDQPLTWPYVSETVSPVEQLTVDSPTGFRSPVMFRRPPGDGPFPLVVVIHGGLTSQPVDQLRSTATRQHNVVRLLAAGYAIAVPTFSSRKEDPQTTAALRDCLAVIEHLRGLPRIDPHSVFVFGGSGGGSLALELAGETKLAAIAAGEPASVLLSGILTKDTLPQLQALMADPLKYCDNDRVRSFTRAKIDKIGCPVLVVQSDVHAINKINNVFVLPMLKEAGKAVQICYVPGVRHGFYFALPENPQAAVAAFDAVDAFFRGHSRTPPKPIAPANLERRSAREGLSERGGS